MKKISILIVVFLLGTIGLLGQESQAKLIERYEVDIKDAGNISNFEVISLKEKGLINVYSEKAPSRSRKWTFKKMDINLNEVSKEEVIVPKRSYFHSSFVTKTHFHALFREGKKGYKIISLELSSMKLKEVSGEFPGKVTFGNMKVIGENVVLDTRTRKEAFLTLINWSIGKTRVLPIKIQGVKTKRIYFQNFQVLEDESELFVFVTAKAEKKTDTYVIQLDRKGNKRDFFCLTKKYENVISDISVSKVADNEYIYTGTYSKYSSVVSSGLFMGKSKGSSVDFIESYNFLKLNNFLSYLSVRKQKRIEKKKKRKERKGKELSYNYRIACHNILKKGDKYILVGEAYYPTYRTETTTDANGNTTTRTIFDGYQYTHAVVAGFDENGGLIWDNTFPLYPSYKPFYVKKFISISEANDKEVQMVFSAGRSIHMKSINNFNGKTIEDKKSEIINTGDEDDKLRRSSAETDYWYERNFVTYGYQKIKNKSGSKKRKRKVYYINKIQY